MDITALFLLSWAVPALISAVFWAFACSHQPTPELKSKATYSCVGLFIILCPILNFIYALYNCCKFIIDILSRICKFIASVLLYPSRHYNKFKESFKQFFITFLIYW